MDDENMTQPRASTRSRIPQAGLREMNPATTNARSGMSGILPPGTIANKAVSPTRTKPTSTVEMKRQPPLTRSMVGAPKAHARGNSYASSTMSRPGSTTSRPNNGTLSNTMGYGSRPASAMSRPQTSLGTRKIHGSSISMARPATSLDHHADENAGSVLGKRKDSVWDQDLKEKDMEEIMARVFSRVNQSGQESQGLKEAVEVYKARIAELEASRDGLNETNMKLRVEMESLNHQLSAAEDALKEALRDQEIAMDDLDRRQRIEMESIRQESQKDVEALNTRHQDEIRSLKRKFESELADEKAARIRELGQLTSKSALDIQRSEIEMDNKTREINAAKAQIQAIKADLERERKMTNDLRHNLDTATTNSVTLESTIRALKARIEFLEGGREEQSQAFEQCNQRMMDALAETEATKEKLRREETLRRKLHNQVQELKGNIRVFCRVRPPLNSEPPTAIALMQYPDESEDAKEINIMGPEERSSLGTVSRKNNSFAFDRVFGPSTQNNEVFDEISQLVQSALDGYNVCIFCYGQTGSGKTHTMSSQDGMIPLAVHQIYETAQSLEEKGWRYTMEGNFVEVYNENLNDLLGHPDELDKKKHEIRHDMQRGKTFITDITTVRLDSPQMVESILKSAAANRSVAATKANERSSRSHSVFILKLIGENHITGERSEGTLNLVDLAGSERLSHSGATGERLKETQNINRSLSSLGDVIAALGQGKDGGHIPYRNSKLTYLLQFSLGGNSKTLMFVMVSPLKAHLSETLTSLKFATKVHNTHIGTAKRQARVRDS
ncbi:Putative Kinesin motor domain protein [Penicillium brasilianum]|uniref:Kinesin-like protein n=1 Tax=Penicillium brasilianum TaxID=104259 RepID=A0A0F7U3K0_PENBI|nr:Putative Kinesin motor domain protein [Penicillium brasilianum]